MKPSTLSGWIVLYLFLIVETVLVVWAVGSAKDIPQGVANVVVAVVSGFLGILTGQALHGAKDGSPDK